MKARIYKPAKSAMQSGRARTSNWVLEFKPASGRSRDPLMGWSSSTDTRSQLRLSFATQEEAVTYARRKGILFTLETPQERTVTPKSYSDNFAYGRKTPWSH